MSNRALVVSLCDFTGKMVIPWLEAGCDAVIVDPQHQATSEELHPSGATLTRISAIIDSSEVYAFIRENLNRITFLAGFPPCTNLATSGSRWFASKAEEDPAFQFKAMQVVWQCYDLARFIGCPFLIENPVSRISTFWRKPDHLFDPYEFTAYIAKDNYTKRTCLWTGQGMQMPFPALLPTVSAAIEGVIAEYGRMIPKGKLPVTFPGYTDYPDNRIHTAAPGPERANLRSETPEGFARAIFEANKDRATCLIRS